MTKKSTPKTAAQSNHSSQGEHAGFWLAPVTIAIVVSLNIVILGYAIVYVNQNSAQGVATHMESGVSGHSITSQSTVPAGGQSSTVGDTKSPLVENVLDLPSELLVRQKYVQHCAACHGLTEKGDGPAAAQLFPQPRNFIESSFRFAATGGNRTEVIGRLENSIAKGIPRSAMPGFEGVLSEEYIAGLAHYVLSLQDKNAVVTKEVEPLQLGERPPTTSGLVQRGQTLYKMLGCVTCHGQEGSGEGLASKGMVDSLGRPIVAADFRQGLYKSGNEPIQLARTIAHGVPGTPMNGYQGALIKTNDAGQRDATDVWALVAYIRSFAGKGPPEGVSSGGLIRVHEMNDVRVIEDPVHPAWLGIEPVTIRLQPLWRSEHIPPVLQVRAIHVDGQIVVCLDWNDATMDLVKSQGKFSDAVAMMLALGDQVPALPMGIRVPGFKAKDPVNIWHWQAHRQADAVVGDMPKTIESDARLSAHLFKFAPSRQVDAVEPAKADVLPEYRTAVQSQNVIAELPGYPALESNAIGFGTLALQPVESQQLHAAALWTAGHWRIVMSRPWSPHDQDDVVLAGRYRIPVAFAVWDGSSDDRGGKKLVSGWQWLVVSDTDPLQSNAQTQPAVEPVQPESDTP